MKEDELRRLAECTMCEQPLGKTKLPFAFFKVTTERFLVDMKAIQRQQGLGMHMGNAALASVMGPNEDMAKAVSPPKVFMICEGCMQDNSMLRIYMAALGGDDNEET